MQNFQEFLSSYEKLNRKFLSLNRKFLSERQRHECIRKRDVLKTIANEMEELVTEANTKGLLMYPERWYQLTDFLKTYY